MTYQKKIIETIKTPNGCIKLSLTDAYNLWKKVGYSGILINNLFEYFIYDLLQGNLYINKWFESRFGTPEKTFLRYLLEQDILERTVAEWENVQIMREDLKYAVSHNKKYYFGDKIEDIKDYIEFWQEKLNKKYLSFQQWAKEETIGTLEEEMEKIVKWAYESINYHDIITLK